MKKFKTIKWICLDCRWVWEVLSVFRDGEELYEQCTTCQSDNTKQIPSAPSVKFNGSGFYETDYK